jgi:hypothetical protein
VGLFTAPSVYRYLDHPDVAAIGAPRPLMVQQCTQDELFSLEAMHLACEDIGQVYADWGHPERFEARFYDVPHSFTGRMQEELFAWLDGWLR